MGSSENIKLNWCWTWSWSGTPLVWCVENFILNYTLMATVYSFYLKLVTKSKKRNKKKKSRLEWNVKIQVSCKSCGMEKDRGDYFITQSSWCHNKPAANLYPTANQTKFSYKVTKVKVTGYIFTASDKRDLSVSFGASVLTTQSSLNAFGFNR